MRKKKAIVEKEKIEHEEIGRGVLKEENRMATYKHKCEKCGYGKAQIIDVGPLYSDEDNLILLKCGKCGYSERIGSKIT